MCLILNPVHGDRVGRFLVGLFLGLIVTVQLALLLVAWPEPDLRSTVCDFPEECLEDIADRFTIVRWIWVGGLLAGAAGVIALARVPRVTALRTALALLGLVGAGLLTPVVRGADAITYDRYSNVSVLTLSYVVAITILTISALLMASDLGTRRRLSPGFSAARI